MKLKVPAGLAVINSPLNGVILTNSFANKYFDTNILEEDIFIDILSKCASWTEYNDLIEHLVNSFNITSEDAEKMINNLVEKCLLVTNDDKRYLKIDLNKDTWEKYNWDDPLKFHIHTNNLKRTDYWDDPQGLEDIERMKQKVKESPPPSNYKEYSDKRIIKLSDKKTLNNKLNLNELFFDDVGEDKKNTYITLEELGIFMYYAFGQIGIKTDPVTGVHIAKTSPSGGARHPAEVYLFVKDIVGLPSGIYHYNVREHALVELEIGEQEQFINEHIICHKNRPGFNYKVAFVHTLIFERSMHRYREPRSYRVVNIDLGHLMQTTALIASYLGWNSYRGYSMHDSIVDSKLGIDGIWESSCSYTLIG
ncbi:hypothetical protein JCM12214_28710 [Geobacillus vulcani]